MRKEIEEYAKELDMNISQIARQAIPFYCKWLLKQRNNTLE